MVCLIATVIHRSLIIDQTNPHHRVPYDSVGHASLSGGGSTVLWVIPVLRVAYGRLTRRLEGDLVTSDSSIAGRESLSAMDYLHVDSCGGECSMTEEVAADRGTAALELPSSLAFV